MAILESLGKYRNSGLLALRVGLGISLMIHGYPKITGGPEMWEGLGGTMKLVGINFLPVVWGFLAAAAEFIGGFLLIIGLFFRPANLFIFITMVMAAVMHLSNNEGFKGASNAIELAVVCFAMIFIGPGKYSVDKK